MIAENEPVLSLFLCLMQRFPGIPCQIVIRIAGSILFQKADTHTAGHHTALHGKLHGTQRFHKGNRLLHQFLMGNVFHKDHELITAGTNHNPIFPKITQKKFRQYYQHLIAGKMAIFFINGLKIVNINCQHPAGCIGIPIQQIFSHQLSADLGIIKSCEEIPLLLIFHSLFLQPFPPMGRFFSDTDFGTHVRQTASAAIRLGPGRADFPSMVHQTVTEIAALFRRYDGP